MSKKFLFLFLIAFSFVTLSCKHDIISGFDEQCVEDEVSSKDSNNPFDDFKKNAYISINMCESERTVLPSTTDVTKLTNLKLTATLTAAGSTPVIVFDGEAYDDAVNGMWGLCTGTYNFKLTGNIKNNRYSGELQNKTITEGNNSVSFELSLDYEDENATGGFELILDVKDADADYAYVEMGGDGPSWAHYGDDDVIERSADGKFHISRNDIPNGDLFFFAEFYKREAGVSRLACPEVKDTKIGEYHEFIYIAPNRTSKAERVIPVLNDIYTLSYETYGAHLSAKGVYSRFDTYDYNTLYLPEGSANPVEDALAGYAVVWKDGYEFLGWYPNADFIGTEKVRYLENTFGDKTFHAYFGIKGYSNNNIKINPGWIEDNDIAIYAQFEGETQKRWDSITLHGDWNESDNEGYFTGNKGFIEPSNDIYCAIAPASKAQNITSLDNISLNFNGQLQTANNNASHIENYRYVVGTGHFSGMGIDLIPIGTVGKFTVKIPEEYCTHQFCKMDLECCKEAGNQKVEFTDIWNLKFDEQNGFSEDGSHESLRFSMNLNNITPDQNKNLVLYSAIGVNTTDDLLLKMYLYDTQGICYEVSGDEMKVENPVSQMYGGAFECSGEAFMVCSSKITASIAPESDITLDVKDNGDGTWTVSIPDEVYAPFAELDPEDAFTPTLLETFINWVWEESWYGLPDGLGTISDNRQSVTINFNNFINKGYVDYNFPGVYELSLVLITEPYMFGIGNGLNYSCVVKFERTFVPVQGN